MLIAAEKYDELENWLTITNGYINNHDNLTRFAKLVLSWARVVNLMGDANHSEKIVGLDENMKNFM